MAKNRLQNKKSYKPRQIWCLAMNDKINGLKTAQVLLTQELAAKMPKYAA